MNLKGLGIPSTQKQPIKEETPYKLTMRDMWQYRPSLREFITQDIPAGISSFFRGGKKSVEELAIGAAGLSFGATSKIDTAIRRVVGIENTEEAKQSRIDANQWFIDAQKATRPELEELPGYIVGNITQIAVGNALIQTQLLKAPKVATWATKFPKTFNAINFGFVGVGKGQLTADLETEMDISSRAKIAAKDFVTWTAWGAVGGIPAKQIHKYFPAYFSIGYLSSKMEGADNESALTSGLMAAAMGSAFKLASIPKQTKDILQTNAKDVFNKYGIKDITKSNYLKLAQQYHPDKPGSPDPSGKAMGEINAAWDVLSQSPKQVEKSIMKEFSEIWKGVTNRPIPKDMALVETGLQPDIPSTIVPRDGITMAKPPRPIKPVEIKPTDLNQKVVETIKKEGLLDTKIDQLDRQQLKDLKVREIASKIRKIDINKLPRDYQDKIKDIADGFDLKFRTNKTLAKRESLSKFLDEMKLEGIEHNIPPELISLATSIPLRDMTPNQLITVGNEIIGLVNQAKLKDRFIAVAEKRKIDEVVKEISTHLVGKVPEGVDKPITPRDFEKKFFEDTKERIVGMVQRTYRLERIFLKLDKYKEKGLMWQTFFNPINEAEGLRITLEGLKKEAFRDFLSKNNLDLKEMVSNKESINKDIILTPMEKVAVYMQSKNPDNLYHLMAGNQYSLQDISDVINSMTPEEKATAEWFLKFYKQDGVNINKIKEDVDGAAMEFIDNYSPIQLEWRTDPVINHEHQSGLEGLMRMKSKWATTRIEKGFIKPRVKKADQPIKINALEIFLNHISNTSHYEAYAPVIRDLQRMIKDPRFIQSYIEKEGRSGYQVLDTWLKDCAKSDPYLVQNSGESLMRHLRVNAVVAGLGINITTALKQFPSWLTGIGETGMLPALKGMYSYVAHPDEVANQIKQYSPTIWKRTMEREVAEAKLLKSLDKRLEDKLSPKEVLMILTTSADKLVVNSLWKGAFDNHLKQNPDKIGDAASYAESIIRKTQPFFSQKDLAEYWRSGEIMKTLTVFTNQLNNYWNYYRFDTWGKFKAKEAGLGETAKRVIYGFVLPAMFVGWISRSRPAKNLKEAAKDTTLQLVRTIPLLGNYISSGLEGWRPSAPIMYEAFSGLQRTSLNLAKKQWKNALKTGTDTIGFAVGVPAKKIKTYMEGLYDLFTGKTDDWWRLIYGEYVREKAKEKKKKPTSYYNLKF